MSTFVRAAFTAGRPDTLGLLFAGKLDLWSIAALGELRSQGLVKPARYLPPWAIDPGWVLSHLTLNAFIANVDLSAVAEAVGELFEQMPTVEIQLPAESPTDPIGDPDPRLRRDFRRPGVET